MRNETKSAVLITAFALLSVFSFTPRAMADLKGDFKDAAGREGCDSIPYQRERVECKDRSNDKDKVCKDFRCDKEGFEKAMIAYKERKELLDQTKDKDGEQAQNLSRKLEELDAKLTEMKNMAQETVHVAYDCLEAREKIQRVFSDVSKMVSAENDPDVKQYVPDLLRKYSVGREEHVVPMQQVTAAVDKCKWITEQNWE